MSKYKFKHPEILKGLQAIFGDAVIEEEIERQSVAVGHFFFWVKGGLTVTVERSEVLGVTPIYNKKGWNPYPAVMPPVEDGTVTPFLVQGGNGEIDVLDFFSFNEVRGWADKDFAVAAFRALPEPYRTDEEK